VVLGEPRFVLGERGRRERFGARRGESLFSRDYRIHQPIRGWNSYGMEPKSQLRSLMNV
jgi:hypothetical protein